MARSREVQLLIIHGFEMIKLYFSFFLLMLMFSIIPISLGKEKIQGYKHSIYFLVIQFVCHMSKFMLGERETFRVKGGFQISFCASVVRMCSLEPMPGWQRTPERPTVHPDPASLLIFQNDSGQVAVPLLHFIVSSSVKMKHCL